MSATHTARSRQIVGIQNVNPRASERVMDYLLSEFDRPDVKDGVRLPTIRQFATRLNVSPPTVHAVLQRLAKQGRIRTVAGSGTYLVSAPQKVPVAKSSDSLSIAMSIPLPEGETSRFWCHRVAAGIMFAACQSKRRIQLVPLPHDVAEGEATVRKLIDERSHVDALILLTLSSEDEATIKTAYDAVNKPIVRINQPDDMAMVNFVATDYYGSSYRLGQIWKTAGRKRLVFMASHFDETPSERLRAAGLLTGWGVTSGTDPGFRVIQAGGCDEASAKKAIEPLLADHAHVPDAIYCAGDYQALGVIESLQKHGLRVPEDVSVVGGTGLDLNHGFCPQMTRLKQPFDDLGKEVLALVCERVEKNNASVPAKLVPAEFMGGATTTARENEFLGIGKS